jgi:DHA1 family bicyclomycin/chloramphenicol resistance-like MFS transporter
MKAPVWLPLLLGFLSAVGPVSTDMYLPAFPAIEASFGLGPGTAQVTLAAWFFGLAVGQVTQGSLSDRFGRRGPLIVGTALYTLASAGCALAPDLFTLSLCRVIAAFGGSAGMVIARAIVRDLTEGIAAARMMSRLILISGVAPILAPTLGGLVLGAASWHAIFWIAAVYGAICCVLVAWKLPDTLPKAMRNSLAPISMLRRYAAIGAERSFLTNALTGGFSMFGMFAYLGGSPVVFEDFYHLSPPLYGALFGACAAGFITGAQISPRLLPRFGADAVMRWAVRLYLIAAAVLTVVAFSGVAPWWGIALPVLCAMACMGFVLPNAAVGAMARHPAQAGSASALMGTLQFLLAATSGLAVGWLTDGTARPMSVLMLSGAVCAVVAETCRPRGPRRPAAPRLATVAAE